MTFKIEIEQPGEGKKTERVGTTVEWGTSIRMIANPNDPKQFVTVKVVESGLHLLTDEFVPGGSCRNVEIEDNIARVYKLGELTVTITRE